MPRVSSLKKPSGKKVVDLRKKVSSGPASGQLKAGSLKRKPASTNFRPKKSSGSPKALKFLIFILIILVAATVASFLLFGGGSLSSNSLKLGFSAPKAIASGEEVLLEIDYENLDKVGLTNLELVIQYPDGFFYNSASYQPANQDHNVWHLPFLAAGQSGSLQINGQLVGEIKSDKEFVIVFHYQPENINSNFNETLTKKIKIEDALLEVETEVPTEIRDGDTVELKARYKNNQKIDMLGLYFAFDFGEAFILDASSTQIVKEVKELKAGESGELIIRGKIDSTKADPLPWLFKVWQWADLGQAKLQERILYHQDGQIDVLAPSLTVNLERTATAELNWGDPVDYRIAYENTGELEINQAVLKLQFNDLIDWPGFNNEAGATLDHNTLVWLSTSSEQTKFLEKIKPGDKGEFIVSVPLTKQPEDLLQRSPEELMISAQTMMSVRFNGQNKDFISEGLVIPVASQARITAEARYNLDQKTAVGQGPVPPQIGRTTTYRIYWKIFPGSKSLSQVRLKTTLPDYVEWQEVKDQPASGSLTFDSSTRQVVWQLDQLSKYTNLLASFDLSVTPSDSQINQLLILTNPTSL
ncbi:MAG: hypothetical protein COU22_00505, partial [Candidatus Komeilibacteria bacterium CG10_big_fil_rev_8_21_14_0_10_41_13]